MTSGRQLRLFVAIELDGAVREALGELQREIRSRGLERLRWTREEGIHLTLKFLGETPEDRVPEIAAAIERAAAGRRPSRLSLGRLGTFGGRRNPRVLWVDLDSDSEPLIALQESVDEALSQLGFPREQRRFSPHLTLARVRPETARDLAAAIEDAVAAVTPTRTEVAVDEVSLMQSTLGPGGAVYNRLASVALEG